MYINIQDELLKLARAPTELNYGEIILLALITNIDKFYMTNEALANLMNTSIRTIKRWLANLKEKGLIDIYYEEVGGATENHGVKNDTIRCQFL